MLKVSFTRPTKKGKPIKTRNCANLDLDYYILIVSFFRDFLFGLAPKPRRRRPTTSSPLTKGNDKTEAEAQPKATTVHRKTIATVNRRSEIATGDQVPAPSVNRFRVRSKPKPEAVSIAGNSSDFTSTSKDKKSKDGYKVNGICNGVER